MNLGVIKTLCEQKQIKFKDLCNEIGISDAGLYKAINNNKISSEYLERLSKYFDVPVSIFFGDIHITSAIDCICNTFERDLKIIKECWNYAEQNIKVLAFITGMDNATIMNYTITDLTEQLPINKQKEFNKQFANMINQILNYMKIIDTKIEKTPSMKFLRSLRDSEIEKLEKGGFISQEIAMYILNFDFRKNFKVNHALFDGKTTIGEYFKRLLHKNLTTTLP